MGQVLNMEIIDELLALSDDGDPELVVDLIQMFLADGPAKLRSIQSGFSSGDLHQVEQAAHSLKGSAGNLGAVAVQNHCEAIQVATRSQRTEGLKLMVDALSRDFRDAEAELKDLLLKYT